MNDFERSIILDDRRDGRTFERLYDEMVRRFVDAHKGVSADDVEFALRCEALGHESILNDVLNRAGRSK